MILGAKQEMITGLAWDAVAGKDNRAAAWKNKQSAYAKTKTQISCAVTAQLISVFVFTTQIVQSLFFLNPNFHASSLFL